MDTSLLLKAAADAAAGQQYPAPALYVLGTPIGNLADLSWRALHVLSLADAVACEDTRVSGAMLTRFGISRTLIALHAHNEARTSGVVLQRLARGERVAYVSDAGTPGVSDPGARLVAQVVAAGYRVVPVPGASSVTAAVSVAGDAQAEGFVFCGFLPSQGAQRRARLQALAAPALAAQALVVFESPHRMDALAADLAATLPARRVTVCRELTKQFEETATLPVPDLAAWLAASNQRQRGEYVLVLHAAPPPLASAPAWPGEAERALAVLLRALPLKQAVALVAEVYSLPRNAVYTRALAERPQAGDAPLQAADTDEAPTADGP